MLNKGIIKVILADGSTPPPILEFGISKNPYLLPKLAQQSPNFEGLEDGVFYVFYRQKGKPWNINQVLIQQVDCTITFTQKKLKNIAYEWISSTKIQLLEAVDNDSLLIHSDGYKLRKLNDYTFLATDNIVVFEENAHISEPIDVMAMV